MMTLPTVATLMHMLTYCRPRGTATEREYVDRFLMTLPNAYRDVYGNVLVTVGDPAGVLFSCHTDTVHRKEGRQTLHMDPATGIVGLSKRASKRYNCLGADDTVGCFLMRAMVQAGVPGQYVFHYGEESGGIGSGELARAYGPWLQGFRMAIAFDRRSTGDVITHQARGRCCSDTFAQSLAAALNAHGLTYAPSDHGIYTDTAEYVEHIAECTNLSVGYNMEHSTRETVDTRHVLQLLSALLVIDWPALTVERVPHDPWLDAPLSDDWHMGIGRRSFEHEPSLTFDMTTGRIFIDRADGAVHVDDSAYDDDEDCGTNGSVTIDPLMENLYLDPEYEQVQRALQRLDERTALQRMADELTATAKRKPLKFRI